MVYEVESLAGLTHSGLTFSTFFKTSLGLTFSTCGGPGTLPVTVMIIGCR
jgi:hypothetical protein